MSERARELIEIIKRLPEGLRSDCQGTNHFELQTPDSPFWLTVDDICYELKETGSLSFQGGIGVPLSKIFDAAAAARELVKIMEEEDETATG